MKKLFLAILVIASINSAKAQTVVPPVTTIIKKGYGNFTIDNKTFPLNSVIINAKANDTSLIEIDFVNGTEAFGHDGVVVPFKKRVNYINGTTGTPFQSYTKLKAYCDTFLYSH